MTTRVVLKGWPESRKLVTQRDKISRLVFESFGKLASLTKKFRLHPWMIAPATCSRGRLIESNCLALSKLLLGHANFPWSMPSTIMTTSGPLQRERPRAIQYDILSANCASRCSYNNVCCMVRAFRWWLNLRIKYLCFTHSLQSAWLLAVRNLMKLKWLAHTCSDRSRLTSSFSFKSF